VVFSNSDIAGNVILQPKRLMGQIYFIALAIGIIQKAMPIHIWRHKMNNDPFLHRIITATQTMRAQPEVQNE